MMSQRHTLVPVSGSLHITFATRVYGKTVRCLQLSTTMTMLVYALAYSHQLQSPTIHYSIGSEITTDLDTL